MPQMIFADIELFRKGIQGQIFCQMFIDIGNNLIYLVIFRDILLGRIRRIVICTAEQDNNKP